MGALMVFAEIVQESGNDKIAIPRRLLNHFHANPIQVVAIVSRQFQHSGALIVRQPSPEKRGINRLSVRPERCAKD